VSSFNVSGLSSGIDTNALLEGLMSAERATVRRLEASRTGDQRALDAWSTVESQLAIIENGIGSILTGEALNAATASTSDETVARVSASNGALAGTYSFQVTSLAAANQEVSAGLADATDLVGAGTTTVAGGLTGIGTTLTTHTLNDGTYQLDVLSVDTGTSQATVLFDGSEQTVDTSTGSFVVTAGDGGTLTLAGTPEVGSAAITVVVTDASTTVGQLVNELNTPGGPVRAQLIDTGAGGATPLRLVLSSRSTGVDGAANVDLSGLSLFSAGLTTLRAASDATISLGAGGLTITRPTNSVTDLFDGLTIDLVGMTAGTDVDLTVGADVDARAEAVTTVIDGVSEALRRISVYTRFDVETGTGGPLVGDFSSRSVASELQQAMGTVVNSSSFVLLSQIGITFQIDGTYDVDEAALSDAVAADPDGVATLLVGDPNDTGDGILDVLADTVDRLGNATGRITTAKSAREASISELDRLIELQEVRLENTEARYRRQFASLETLLGQLQSQSSYLTSALGGLQ
jgi:flagellar hook-associated protein 2